jgi:enamine deaminase RidA (YjgF/YER057c/UK114 family)
MSGGPDRLYILPPEGCGRLPFSNGVLVGNTLYLAGHIGVEAGCKKVPETVESEIELLIEALKTTLGKAGLTLNDLVYVQVFCSDVSLFERFNAAYLQYLAEPLPARAFIGTGPLLFGARFEVQGIAVKR